MSERLSIGISTCPNDTFAFHGLMERRVDARGFDFDFELHDVEALNQGLLRGEFQVAKASFHAAMALAGNYVALPVGAALGFGVGPILLARAGASRGADGALQGRILAPGEHTTAALLLQLFHSNEGAVEQRVFSEIMPALERGDADYGVCIHEGRFTWQGSGLEFVEDLGERWETSTGLPLPLGGILAQRSLGVERLERLALAIRASIEYGFEHRGDAITTMRRYAQELSDDALWKHVELYVNADTLALSADAERALHELNRRALAAGVRINDGRGLEIAPAQALKRIFRIATPEDCELITLGRTRAFSERALEPDGFVHLSFAEQIGGTLQRHYAGATSLALIEIDRERVRSALRIEPSRGGSDFPHLYRTLEEADLLRQWPLTKRAGAFELPDLASGSVFDRPSGHPI